MTASPANSVFTVFATVLATAVPTTNSARKLKNTEKAGANRAGSAPVATTVPTQLAASWKPLVKSKINAAATSSTIVMSVQSTVVFPTEAPDPQPSLGPTQEPGAQARVEA
jgi:hypothetical protein